MNDRPVLDPKPLQDLLDLGAEAELIQELITLFLEDVPIHMAALRRALEASDVEQVLQEAHQLKGALGNLGLVRFADLAAQMEAQAREGNLEQTPVLAAALPAAFEAAREALNVAFPGT